MRNLVAPPVNIQELSLQMLSFGKCNAVYQKINLAKLVLHLFEERVKQRVVNDIALRINRIVQFLHERDTPLLCPRLVGSAYPAASLVKLFGNVPCYAFVICNAENYCFLAFQVDCETHFIASEK